MNDLLISLGIIISLTICIVCIVGSLGYAFGYSE